MLTRSRLRCGEGMLEEIDLEVGKRKVAQHLTMGGYDVGETPKVKVMGDEQIHQMFLNMQWMF